eukprot:scaffold310_cov168-Amphora_coffeaeformis.AAC.44
MSRAHPIASSSILLDTGDAQCDGQRRVQLTIRPPFDRHQFDPCTDTVPEWGPFRRARRVRCTRHLLPTQFDRRHRSVIVPDARHA